MYLTVLLLKSFQILGLGILGVGIWARVSLAYYMKLSSDDYAGAAYLLIGAGVLVSLIAFIGCCGAYKENVCMLKMVYDSSSE